MWWVGLLDKSGIDSFGYRIRVPHTKVPFINTSREFQTMIFLFGGRFGTSELVFLVRRKNLTALENCHEDDYVAYYLMENDFHSYRDS